MQTQPQKAFPVDDIRAVLDPLHHRAMLLLEKKKTASGAKLYPLDVPVLHVVRAEYDRNQPREDQMRRLLEIAFQYGVCQGWAMRDKDYRELRDIVDTLMLLAKSKQEKAKGVE